MSKPKLHTIKPFHYVEYGDEFYWMDSAGHVQWDTYKPAGIQDDCGNWICRVADLRGRIAALTLLADAIDPKPAPKTRRKKG